MGYATANTQQPHALGSFLGKERSLLKRPKKERSNGYRIKYPIRVVIWTLRFVLHIKIIRSNGSYGVSDLIRSGAYWTTPGSLKYNKIERNDSQETIRSRESRVRDGTERSTNRPNDAKPVRGLVSYAVLLTRVPGPALLGPWAALLSRPLASLPRFLCPCTIIRRTLTNDLLISAVNFVWTS